MSRDILIVTLERYGDEALLPYALRLADANGYAGGAVLKQLLERGTETSISLTPRIAADGDVLHALEGLADKPSTSLTSIAWRPMQSAAGQYYNVRGAAIPDDALMLGHAQICPRCLSEHGYAKEDWDLSGVTTCTSHRAALLDYCPNCQKRLSTVRVPLAACSHCHTDLRDVKTEPASAAELQVTDYLAALAPYRLDVGGEMIIDYAESLFAIVQILSFSTTDVLNERWRSNQLSKLRIPERLAAVRRLASALNNHSIQGDRLCKQLRQHVAHRLPYMNEQSAIQPLKRFIYSSDFLSTAAKKILTYGDNQPPPMASAVFNGRPPSFFSQQEVMQFLDCTAPAFKWLLKKEYVRLPVGELGFDADEVIAAQRRLSLFLTFNEMDLRLGVSGLTQSLVDWRVLQSAAGHDSSWLVIDMLEMGVVLDYLRIQSADNDRADTPDCICLFEETVGTAIQGETFAMLFARLLRSEIDYLHWRAPYTMKDVWVSVKDWQAISSAMSV